MKKRILVGLGAALFAGVVAYLLLSGIRLLGRVPTDLPQTDRGAEAIAPPVQTSPVTVTATVTAVSTSTAPVIMSAAEFAQKADSVQGTLPTTAQLRALSAEEVHRTPKLLVRAAVEIGDLGDAIEKNPALAPQGLAFYEKCAKRAELATAVRATCLANQRDLARELKVEANEAGIPTGIKNLATKLRE